MEFNEVLDIVNIMKLRNNGKLSYEDYVYLTEIREIPRSTIIEALETTDNMTTFDGRSPRFINKSDAAKYINVNIETVEKLISEGDLPVIKLNSKTYRIDILDIEKMLNSRKIETQK